MKIGLTGGMGCGKSTVMSRMRLHLPQYKFLSYDERVHELYADPDFCAKLQIHLGSCDRARVSRIVFADPDAMSILLDLTNGVMDEWVASVPQNSVTEVPLMFEGHYRSCFDTVICITCDPKTQWERIRTRDGLTDAQISARLDRHFPLDVKATMSEHVIYTDSAEYGIGAQIRDTLHDLGLDDAQAC